MFKQILAIIAAAACAALVVIVPELASESAMASTQSGQFGVPSLEVVVAKEAQKSKNDCSQGWPYYEHACTTHACRTARGKWCASLLLIASTRIEHINVQRAERNHAAIRKWFKANRRRIAAKRRVCRSGQHRNHRLCRRGKLFRHVSQSNAQRRSTSASSQPPAAGN